MKTEQVTRIDMGRFADVFATMPGYKLSDRLTAVISKRQKIRAIVTIDSYRELRIYWGLLNSRKVRSVSS